MVCWLHHVVVVVAVQYSCAEMLIAVVQRKASFSSCEKPLSFSSFFPTLPEQPPPSLPPLLPPLYDNIPCTIMYVWSSHHRHRHHQPHNSIQSPPPPPSVKDVVHMREKLKPLSFLYAAAQQYKALDRLASRSGSSIGGGGGCSIMLSLC